MGFASKSGHAITAPARSDLDPSGITIAGLAPFWVPSPSHDGHQPSGLLKEK
jgi:hypothetical protein